MKKIVSAVAAGALLAGAAFADAKLSVNGRIESDVFKYESSSKSYQASDENGKGVDDTGKVTAMTPTKNADDVTFSASGDNSGVKVVVTGGLGTTSFEAGTYQVWIKDLFGLRLDAGKYDTRLGKNINNDGNWTTNLSGSNKPGIFINFDGAAWGKDSSNITSIKGSKANNFKVMKKVNDQLEVSGVVFMNTTATNGEQVTHNEKWIFTPFAVGGKYALDGDTTLAFNAKLSSITHGKKTEAASYYVTDTSLVVGDGVTTAKSETAVAMGAYGKKGTYYYDLTGTNIGTTATALAAGTEYYKVTVAENAATTYTPDNSVWTLNADFSKKLSDALTVEAGYTLGASLYSDWSKIQGHKNGRLVRDDDVFAHGFDFRAQDKLNDQLSLTFVSNVSYVQGTARQKALNNATSASDNGFKDARAKSYATGAAGTLGYFATLSVDYKQSDLMTFQVQTKLQNSNVFATSFGDSSKAHVDYYKNLSWVIRPGVIINPDKNSFVFAGVQLTVDGFHQNATGKNNTVKTTTTIPVGLRVKL